MDAITLSCMEFHDKLKKIRELRRLSQRDLSERVGKLQSRISQLENSPTTAHGERKLEPSLLLDLANALNVPVRFLCDPNVTSLDNLPEDLAELSEKERQIMATVRALGYDRAFARLIQAEEPRPRSGQGDLPFGEQLPPQTLKHLGSHGVAKRAKAEEPEQVPKGKSPRGKAPKKKKPDTPR